MQTPEVVVFDLGKVLLDFDYDIAIRRFAERSDVGIDKVRELINSSVQYDYESGKITTDEFFSYVRNGAGFQGGRSEFVDFFSTVIIKDKKSVMKDLPDNVKGQYEITVNGKIIQIPNVYIKEFNSGYQTWKQNKFIGGGIKSFRKNCAHSGKSLNILNCSTHPHNYYLEILSELGIIGFVLLIFIFSKVFYDILIKRYMSEYRFKKNDIIIPFMFLLFLEIFPIRTTGSFFTTANATYIFLLMAITIALFQSNDKKI